MYHVGTLDGYLAPVSHRRPLPELPKVNGDEDDFKEKYDDKNGVYSGKDDEN